VGEQSQAAAAAAAAAAGLQAAWRGYRTRLQVIAQLDADTEAMK
jgi:hypothetical protein